MNILFDESVDLRFQKDFALRHANHRVSNLTVMNWSAGSDVMRDLTFAQKDELLLRLAEKAGFTLFITADIRFQPVMASSLHVLVIDAQDGAPSWGFLTSVAFAVEEQIALIESGGGELLRGRPVVIQNKVYLPETALYATSSRVASEKLRPIRSMER